MLVALCPHCSFSREVRDQLKGREAACPRCGTIFQIGGEAPAEQDELTLKVEPAFASKSAAVILVMIKPLIFGWGGKDTRFEITPEREPLLFDLIRHLCRFVGAPMPKRVFVNCDVNAYAGMTHGIWGAIFGGNACDLMIGLPLVAGMKTSELVGILAHEFGHFTQAGTRRMDTIVRRILHWFSHIYYCRDSMDGWILAGARSGFHDFIFFFWIVLAVVWVARRFIWILMMLGNFVAGFMSRQMEYDADSYEIRLAGSARFPESSAKMTMLNIANSRTGGCELPLGGDDPLPLVAGA